MIPAIRRDLGLQLLALYLLFVGPVVMASLVLDRLASQRLESDVKATDLALARAIALETNATLENALQSVHQLASYPVVIAADPQEMASVFHVLMSGRQDINLIYRLDSHGTMLYHYPPGPGSTVGWDFSFRDYFQRAQEETQPFLSKGRISPTTGQAVATAVMPIWSDGEFLGLVATNLKLQVISHALTNIISDDQNTGAFQIYIIDTGGNVIANPDPQLLLESLSADIPAVTSAVLQGLSGNLIDEKQGNLFSYAPIPSAKWGVIISRPTSTAFATPRATHRGVLLLVGFFLLVGIFFWFALSRQVIRPLELLAGFSQTIGVEEHPSPMQAQNVQPLIQRADQIGNLSRSLVLMGEAIEARLRELSTLLQTSAAVVSTLDNQKVLDRILEQVERLMNLSMCAIVALDEDKGVFRVKASRGLSRSYTEHLAIDPAEPQSITLRAIRSGQPIQVSDTETDPSYQAFRARSRSEGYRAILGLALQSPHTPPAALLVYLPEPHTFTQREINLLTNFANQAAMAIENSALYARSDMRLQEQTRRLEALIQSLQDGLVLEDLNGKVVYANRRIQELADLSPAEVTGIPVAKLLERVLSNAHQPGQIQEAIEEQMNSRGQANVEIELSLNAQSVVLLLQISDVTDTQGLPIGRLRLFQDITRARELDRMKTSLISTVSHELRTPLASIKGYTTTLLAEDVEWDQAAQREFLEIISQETDRLSELVSELLDISRIEAGILVVSRSECNLEELIERAADRVQPRPDKRLELHLQKDLPFVYADAPRLESVLRNLIENAAKYAGEDSPIRIFAEVQSHNLVVRVEDEGPGIPAEHSLHIFESFYRVEGGLARSVSGAGLGLAIAQGFVRAHGGEIWIEPRPRGTCIGFSIPLFPEETAGRHEQQAAREIT